MNNRRSSYRNRNRLANISTRELVDELENRKRVARSRRRQAGNMRRKQANFPTLFFAQFPNSDYDTDEEAYEDFVEIMSSQLPSFRPLGFTPASESIAGRDIRIDFEANPREVYQLTLDSGMEFATFADSGKFVDELVAKRGLSGGTSLYDYF